MNRSLGFFAAAMLALAGGAASAPTPDERLRAAALDRLVQAARTTDEPAMWANLSRASRRRLGPTLAEFRERGARGVRAGVAPFVSGYDVVVNTDIGRAYGGVVAVSKGPDALAAAMRWEQPAWKIEILPAFTVEAVRPLPRERVLRRTQLAAEIVAPRPIRAAAMWFDGRFFDARAYFSPNGKRMSLWGEAPQPLRAGRHTVVAFASAGPYAAANAWTFTVSLGSGASLAEEASERRSGPKAPRRGSGSR